MRCAWPAGCAPCPSPPPRSLRGTSAPSTPTVCPRANRPGLEAAFARDEEILVGHATELAWADFARAVAWPGCWSTPTHRTHRVQRAFPGHRRRPPDPVLHRGPAPSHPGPRPALHLARLRCPSAAVRGRPCDPLHRRWRDHPGQRRPPLFLPPPPRPPTKQSGPHRTRSPPPSRRHRHRMRDLARRWPRRPRVAEDLLAHIAHRLTSPVGGRAPAFRSVPGRREQVVPPKGGRGRVL